MVAYSFITFLANSSRLLNMVLFARLLHYFSSHCLCDGTTTWPHPFSRAVLIQHVFLSNCNMKIKKDASLFQAIGVCITCSVMSSMQAVVLC